MTNLSVSVSLGLQEEFNLARRVWSMAVADVAVWTSRAEVNVLNMWSGKPLRASWASSKSSHSPLPEPLPPDLSEETLCLGLYEGWGSTECGAAWWYMRNQYGTVSHLLMDLVQIFFFCVRLFLTKQVYRVRLGLFILKMWQVGGRVKNDYFLLASTRRSVHDPPVSVHKSNQCIFLYFT